ncbi:hypothetical protein PtA15_4A675 [Puccinia triticina]|uniref:hAT-like transposase RNase-H fold domain-containing protein n=1 Tax=Puccinia triticina TaxID=208348 RepID=A0ABY7CIM9_9BASI|nr:uncharacterized protein PtA15_4A675 [Puccinia triticina]WAQ84223.1 hypothetical protein PtA15_4A675 [Puccinia triticina]WAR55052.1 hypothetical protein PtB15_4B671 [Puccinia triticina]
MGCGTAAIKQITQDAFKTSQEAITNLQQVVRLVTYSDASEESFKEVAINCGLPLTIIPSRDIVDRWDSTYSMISDALNFQRAFEHLQATKPEYLDGPTATEWLHLKTIKDALEVFHDAAGSLSSTDSPSANRSYLSMKKIESYLSKPEHYENNHSINIISPMANAFEKYWGTIQEFSEIASILDPHLKLHYLEFSLVKQHGATVIQEKLAIAKNRNFISVGGKGAKLADQGQATTRPEAAPKRSYSDALLNRHTHHPAICIDPHKLSGPPPSAKNLPLISTRHSDLDLDSLF